MVGTTAASVGSGLLRQRLVRSFSESRKVPNLAGTIISTPAIDKNRTFSDHMPCCGFILDPASNVFLAWNHVFLVFSMVAVVIDPLFFYVPVIDYGSPRACARRDTALSIAITSFRSLTDLLYALHIIVQFHTAFLDSSSKTTMAFGGGELITDPKAIAVRYPASEVSEREHTNYAITLIILIQYMPRLYLISRMHARIISARGVLIKTALAGAAYNLVLYLIASHVLGAIWYLLSVDRQVTCWKESCVQEPNCRVQYLQCSFVGADLSWENSTAIFANCNAASSNRTFNFGIFQQSLSMAVPAQGFLKKCLFCFWWGLQNLRSVGIIGETVYGIILANAGLVLIALLLGNVKVLQSAAVRVEEWRLRKRDAERWMQHTHLPPDLQDRVRRFTQYKWFATRGVDEESILQTLPPDLRRNIKRHMCLDLVRRVRFHLSFFANMDDQLLDAICERLVSFLIPEGTYIVREGDVVMEMLLIIRGKLESSTTNSGRTGFFNSTVLRPGDFCGEELLSWALHNSMTSMPPSGGLGLLASFRQFGAGTRGKKIQITCHSIIITTKIQDWTSWHR